MSDRSDQLARKLFKSTIHPTSSLHDLLSLLGNIHDHSITSPLKISSHPTRTKKYQSFFSHVLTHYQTSFFPTVFIIFCVLFLCLLSTIVQPLAITFNKRTNRTQSFSDIMSSCEFLSLILHGHISGETRKKSRRREINDTKSDKRVIYLH